MPNYAISTIFNAKDKVTAAFSRMSSGAKKFGGAADRSFQRASRGARGFQSITKGILAASAVQRGIGLLSQGVGEATRQYIDFDDAIFGATARFQDAQEEGANVVKIMQDLRIAARKTGAETQFTAAQAAQGLDFYARAGFRSAEAIAVLKSQIDLVTASGEDFALVTDMTSDLLGAFGGANLESAKKVEMLKELSAQLGVAVNTANVKVEDLFETLKTAAPIATAAGGKMKEIIAVTAALGSAGIKGTLGATAVKNIFLRLVKPTKEARKALEGVGLQFSEFINQKGDMISVTKILEKIGTATKGLGKAKKLAVFAELFGLRATAGAVNIEKNIDQITAAMIKLGNDPQAQMKKLADFMRQSLGNRLKILQSTAIDLGFRFFTAFEKRGKGGIDALTAAVRKFDVNPIIDGIEKTIKLTKSAIKVFKTLFNILKPFSDIIPVIVGGMVAYNLALKVQTGLGVIAFYLAMANGLTGVAGAQAILNAVMAANPIGAVIFGITALIGVIVLVYKNWDALTNFMTNTLKTAAVFWIGVWDKMKIKFSEFAAAFPKTWGEAVDIMTKVFKTFIEVFKTLFSVAIQVISRLFFSFVGLYTSTFGDIIKVIIKTTSKIGKFLKFDTSGLDSVVAKLDVIQKKVKEKSIAGISLGGGETKVININEFDKVNIPKMQIMRPELPKTMLTDLTFNVPIIPELNNPIVRMPDVGEVKIEKPENEIVPPNRSELELRQNINFNGRLQIAGAPEGSTMDSKTSGAPPIRTEFLGAGA